MSDTIAEFLVSLGYQLNESQQRKFDAMMVSNTQRSKVLDDSLQDIAKTLGVLGDKLVQLSDRPHNQLENAQNRLMDRNERLSTSFKRLGWTAVGTVSTLVTGFTALAKQYDNLYYVSQRTGLSGGALSTLGFAGSQSGANLVGVAEGLARSGRNPGLAGLLRGFGVQVGPNGELSPQSVIQFLEAMKQFPPVIQDIYRGMLGISDIDFRNSMNNLQQIIKDSEKWDKLLKESGINWTSFLNNAHTATNQFSEAWQKVELIMVQAFQEAFPEANKLMTTLNDMLAWTIAFNSSHPFAALNEATVAAIAGATTLLGVLQKISGIPLLSGPASGAAAVAGSGAGAVGVGLAGIGASVWELWRLYKAHGLKGMGLDPNALVNPGKPSFAEGGIVPINAHAGEMVLPTNISQGLQGLFAGGGWGETIRSWLMGGTSYVPLVRIYGFDPSGSGFTGGNIGTGSFPGQPGSAGGGATSRPAGRFGGAAPSAGGGSSVNAPGGGNIPGGSMPDYGGKIDRSKFAEELRSNPALREKILRIAANEQGSNPLGVQAVLESMMNRAQVRGTTLAEQAKWYQSEGGYYAQGNMGRGALENPTHRAVLENALKNALNNSNVSNYATDNASGSFAAGERASGKFKYASSYGGETFFTPGWGEPGQEKRYAQWIKSVTGGGSASQVANTSLNNLGYTDEELAYWKFNREHPGAMLTWKDWHNRTLEGKQSSVTNNHNTGDRTVHVTQNNHFHGTGNPDGTALKALHSYAGRISRNVQTNIV